MDCGGYDFEMALVYHLVRCFLIGLHLSEHLILSKVGVSGLLGVFHRLALTDETSLTHETSKGEVGQVAKHNKYGGRT